MTNRSIPLLPVGADLDIVQDDNGLFALGLGDDAPAFPTRSFARAVSASADRRNRVEQRAEVRAIKPPNNRPRHPALSMVRCG